MYPVHTVHITFGAPLNHQRVSLSVIGLPPEQLHRDADKMFEEMVWFGYFPAPVAEIDQKLKQDVTG